MMMMIESTMAVRFPGSPSFCSSSAVSRNSLVVYINIQTCTFSFTFLTFSQETNTALILKLLNIFVCRLSFYLYLGGSFRCPRHLTPARALWLFQHSSVPYLILTLCSVFFFFSSFFLIARS